MIDVQLHFRGKPAEPRPFHAIPRVADLVDADGLWRVAAVVLGATVDVFCVKAADSVGAELAGWGDAPAEVEQEPATAQKALF
jgi:hypothetical protein